VNSYEQITSHEPQATVGYADLIGKPYLEGGRGPSGFDCWGIVTEAARRASIELPQLDVPDDNDLRKNLIDEQRTSGFTRIDTARPYTVALFRIIDDENKIKWHVGFMLDGRRFIHTTQKMGCNISDVTRQPWRLFVEGFYEFSDRSDLSDGSE